MREEKRSWRERVRDWVRGVEPASEKVAAGAVARPVPGQVGICCSGGGIRSASFNLGALQVMQEEKVLEKARYVSAVSGGAYIASSFATVASKTSRELLENGPPVYAPGSPEEQHLRNHSTYMAPGLGGKVRLALRLLLGLALNLGLIAVVTYLVAVPYGWVLEQLYDQLGESGAVGSLDLPRYILWPILGLAATTALLAVPDLLFRLRDSESQFLRTLRTYRGREVWIYRLLFLATLGFILLVAAPQAILWARDAGGILADLAGMLPIESDNSAEEGTGIFAVLNLGSIVATVLGAAWAFVRRRPSIFAMLAGAVAGPLVVITAFLSFANVSATDGALASSRVLGAAAIVAGILWLFADLTQWSLHPFYRRRLSSAFFVHRVRGEDGRTYAEEVDYKQRFPLSSLDPQGFFPELIVCAAANVSDLGRTPPGRGASPFAFSRHEVGGPLVGRTTTAAYENQAERTQRDITLPAAVAMSGAAVSPVMGKLSIRALSFLMGLVNVRLGVWVPNPRRAKDVRKGRLGVLGEPGRIGDRSRRSRGERLLELVGRWRVTPLYLFWEMLGRTSLDDRFLYVTDGGHYDNLGLVELLRRGCTTIYCFDGGGDPSGTYRALGEAVALARGDLEVDVEIDPKEIAPDEKTRISKSCVAVGRITYRVTPSGERVSESVSAKPEELTGTIVYCRAAVTEDAPWDVKAYHEKTRRFPYHSTFDQLFDDQQFEAYRALGAHAGRRAVAKVRERERADARRRRRARWRAAVRALVSDSSGQG